MSLPLDQVTSLTAKGQRLVVNGKPFHDFEKIGTATVRGVAWKILEFDWSRYTDDGAPSSPPFQPPQKFRVLPSDREIRQAMMSRLAGKARVHVSPDIPAKVFKGAVGSIAQAVDKDDVLFIVDDSFKDDAESGEDAEYGLLATKDMVFVRERTKSPVSRLLGPGPMDFTASARRILLDKNHLAIFLCLKEPGVADVADALGYLAGMYVPETSLPARPAPEARTSVAAAPVMPGQLPPPSSPPPSATEIRSKLRTALDGASNTFVSPDIPPKKLKGAVESFASGVLEKDVLFVLDDTVFGGAGVGLLATRDRVYAKELRLDPVSAWLGPPPASILAYGKKIGVDGKQLADLSISAETAAKVVAALDYLAGLTGPRLPKPARASSPVPGSMPGSQPFSQYAGPGISEILSVLSSKLVNLSSVFLTPSIPPEKLHKAIKSYASNVMGRDVLILVDTTLFGSAADGMLITRNMVYAKDLWGPPVSVSLGPPAPPFTADENKIRINGVQLANFSRLTETATAAVANALRYLADLREAPQTPATSSRPAAPAPAPAPKAGSRPSPMPPSRPGSETSPGNAKAAAPHCRPVPETSPGQAKAGAPPCRPVPETSPGHAKAAAPTGRPFGQTEPPIPPARPEPASHPVRTEPPVPPSPLSGSLACRIPESPAQAAAPSTEAAIRVKTILHGVGNVSVCPELDMGKLGTALVGFASAARAADVIFQVHDTSSPGGSAVMVVTGDAVHARPEGDVGGSVRLSPENPPVMVSGEHLLMGGTPFARLDGMSDRERQAVALAVSFVAITCASGTPSPGTAPSCWSSRTLPLSPPPLSAPAGPPQALDVPPPSSHAPASQAPDSATGSGTAADRTPPASRPFWEDIPASIPVSPTRKVAETGRVSLEKPPLTDADRARDASGFAARKLKGD
jgi:hypothetical protein